MKKIVKNLCAWTVSMFALAGMMTSCDNKDESIPEPTFPAVELENQIWYNGEVIDIKSAAYSEDNDLYTFYLSPVEGLTSIQGILATDSYLTVTSSNPMGEQTAEDSYSISYQGVTVSSASLSADVKEHQLEVSVYYDGTLNINVAAAMESGAKLMASYTGACPEAVSLPELNNQCQNGKDVAAMESVKVEYDFDATTYYAYDASTNPVLVISAPLGTDFTSVDLATANDVKLTVAGAEAVSGVLAVTVTKTDRPGITDKVTVTVEEAKDAAGNLIRAKYNGEFEVAAKSNLKSDITTVLPDAKTTTTLSKVFLKSDETSYKFVFGTKTGAADPKELKIEGHFAVELTLSAIAMPAEGELVTIDLTSTDYSLKVYDYTRHGSWDNSHKYDDPQMAPLNDVTSGTAKLAKFGNNYFIAFDVELKKNEQTPAAMTMSGGWYGEATAITEVPYMVPPIPAEGIFQLLNEDKTEIVNGNTRKITEIQVAKVEGEKISGSFYTATYYYFYLMTENSGSYSKSAESAATPRLRIREEYLGKDIDVKTEGEKLLVLEKYIKDNNLSTYSASSWTKEQQDEAMKASTTSWELYYTNQQFFSNASFGNPALNSISSSAWPGEGTVRVDFDEETKNAKISVSLKSYTYYGYSGHTLGSNTYGDKKTWFEANVEGTCVKYTGKGANDGFSASSSVDSMVWE